MTYKGILKFQEGGRARPSPPSHMESEGYLSASPRLQQRSELMTACI